MNINELKKMKKAPELPFGKNEVTFKEIQYRTDNFTGDVNGVFVHIENFKPLYLNFFANGQNFQLDLLLDQLGCDSYDPDEINKAKGTVIIAHRYTRETETGTFTNTSFNPNYVATDETDILA